MAGVAITLGDVALEQQAEHQARNHRLPGWLRVWCWAVAHVDDHGHARALAGQLRRDLALDNSRDVSRAIHYAKRRQLIDPASTAACIVLPGHALGPCDATHRVT
jgi:hypothetical protein